MDTRNDEQVVDGVTMPPLHNMRAGKMWDIISAHVDFKGKRVVDLGCGHGDLIIRIATVAKSLMGFDENSLAIHDCMTKANLAKLENIAFVNHDISSVRLIKDASDVFVCCSVLPYLPLASQFINNMARNAPLSIIECQYAGDGPGFPDIENDDDMKTWLLSAGWSTVTPIGKTHVEGRDKWRTIWKCEQ